MMSQMLERQHIVEVRINRSAALTPLLFPRRPFRPRAALPSQISHPRCYRQILISRPQNQFSESLHALHERLITIEELQTQFTEYQLSYNKLVVEMGRRLQYREAAENIVRGMIDQLAALTEGSRPILPTRPLPS